jgi:diguanylate cyclase (GGDEF)-like protein
MVLLGFVLARVLQSQLDARLLADENQTARLIAQIAIRPHIDAATLRNGLSPAALHALDAELGSHEVRRELARIKLWNRSDRVIYSDQPAIIGHAFSPSDELQRALAGHPQDARILTPRPHTEEAGEIGLGTLVETYVPLRLAATGPPAGAFEIYLRYAPVAGAIARDKRTITLLVAGGLALLWLVLYRIVARASARLRRQAQDNDRLARYDTLTGLPNRRLFTERLDRALREPAQRARIAVLVVDLHDFRRLNSTLGAATGDRVLRDVADRLRGLDPGAVDVARLGDDEFALRCESADAQAPGRREAAAVAELFERPVHIDEIALAVEAGIGVAAARDDVRDAAELLQRAEVALSRARSSGRAIEVYAPARDQFDPSRLMLLGQVRTAIERGELILHYQPKLDCRSGRISGVEGLLRWQHAERGLLGPLEFIPLIEPTALVGPVTLHVVEQAAAQLATWRAQGLDLDMAVNLSARNLADEDLPAGLLTILARHGVPPELFTVEVTESAAMTDPDRAVAILRELRATGMGVAIDDFGTGNASIGYLARLPATELKIDRSLVTGIDAGGHGEALVRSVVDLARNLRVSVVAEGVETDEALARVSELGCDKAQGYAIARPLPAARIAAMLAGAQSSPAARARQAPVRRRAKTPAPAARDA